MSEEKELKPCPMCGGKARFVTIEDEGGDNDNGEVIECSKCQLSTVVVFHVMEDGRYKIIEQWNSRPAEERLERRVRDLEELLHLERCPLDAIDCERCFNALKIQRAALEKGAGQ